MSESGYVTTPERLVADEPWDEDEDILVAAPTPAMPAIKADLSKGIASEKAIAAAPAKYRKKGAPPTWLKKRLVEKGLYKKGV